VKQVKLDHVMVVVWCFEVLAVEMAFEDVAG